ncbi:MAG: autotransporter outer membrane beta-barrel domain-containing protein, partial [Paludibacter sp.]
IPTGATDTYYIKNGDGKYLNSYNNNWDASLQAAINGTRSEWVISGTLATAIRLKNNFSQYLASDNIAVESQLYCDKAVGNANGEFSLTVAAVAAKFDIAGGNLVTEVENGLGLVSPIYVTASGQTYDINLALTGGYTTDKAVFTPTDFASGSVKINISQGTSILNGTGTAVFSYSDGTVHTIATANIATVAPYIRYYIKNNTDPAANLVIGNETSNLYPALTVKKGANTQKFTFRRVNVIPASIIDTFYIRQDSVYRLMRKDPTSGWNTDFGIPANEAKWTKHDNGDGTFSLTNVVTGKQLGSDAPAANGRLYDDKTYPANNTAWLIQEVTGLPEISATGTFAAMAASVASTDSKTISVSGFDLQGDLTLAISGTNANQFSVSPTTLTMASGIVGATTVTVTYTPTVVSAGHVATLTISSTNATSKTFNLTGSSSGTGLNQLTSLVRTVVVNGNLTVTGADSYAVYSVQGMKVADVKVNTANTFVALKSGVYLVKTAGNVQKVLVK